VVVRFRGGGVAAFASILAGVGAVSGCAGLLGLEDRAADGVDATPPPDAGQDAVADATSPSDATAPPDAAPLPEAASPDGPPSTPDAAPCADPCDMADGLNEPFVMTSDAYNVYWVDFGDSVGAGNGELRACSVNGCNGMPAVWQSGLMDPRGIAVDATHVYWGTTWGGIVGAQGAIWSCNVSGGPTGCQTPTKLAAALDPYGLAVDATYVYWVDANLNTVHRVKANGSGTDEVLYTPPGTDGGLGVFLDSPVRCAVDGTNLYILDLQANAYRMPKGGGSPVMIASGNNIISDIAADGTGAVYFGEQGNVRRSSAGMLLALVSTSTTTINQPDGLALDNLTGMLYWADFGSGVTNDGTIGRVSTDGTQATLLQQSLATPSSVTVSGNYVYWLSAGDLLSSTSTSTTYVANNTGRLFRTHK
jgi:hypothetical protein